MPAYRDVAAVGEFRALFGGRAAASAAATMQMLALAALIYARTGSPLLAALAYVAGSLPQALGAMTLLAVADRVPPRRLLAGWGLLRALAVALLAAGVLPVWAALVLLMAAGAVDGVVSGAGYALLADVLPGQYVLGRSVLNMADGATQVAGYGAGGVLLASLGARQALWAAAGLTIVSAVVYRHGLHERPARGAGGGHASFGQTWRTNKELFGNTKPEACCWPSGCPTG